VFQVILVTILFYRSGTGTQYYKFRSTSTFACASREPFAFLQGLSKKFLEALWARFTVYLQKQTCGHRYRGEKNKIQRCMPRLFALQVTVSLPGVPMEVMGLMLGEFVDEYTVRVIDVFAMPQSGTVH
jgi:hypothetical protein